MADKVFKMAGFMQSLPTRFFWYIIVTNVNTKYKLEQSDFFIENSEKNYFSEILKYFKIMSKTE